MSDKPKVLVLGGLGFIGRNFVKFLVDGDLCSKIRVVDKAMKEMAMLAPIHEAAFDSPVVECKQGDVTRPATIAKVFPCDEGEFDFVFNLAGETKYGLDDDVYKQKTLGLATTVGQECATRGIKLIHVSSGQVYKPSDKPRAEDGKLGPWTKVADYSLQAEEAFKGMENLNVVVLRPAIVYGPGDVGGLMPRIICAAVYKHLKEKMKFLWDGALKINTVHVTDVVAAMWHAAVSLKTGGLFNLADEGNTDQDKFNTILESIFGIKTGYIGGLVSNLARVKLSEVAQASNEKHMTPWTEICNKQSVLNTPLSPYIDAELLLHNHLYLDGTAITATGFEYKHKAPSVDLIMEEISVWQEQGLFPKLDI